MKIYAVRDRLIDYFQTPFVAPGDNEVKAAMARMINNGEVTSDIQQAPHQFQIWCLGEVHEDGHIEPQQVIVAECASLIRSGLRTGAGPGNAEATDAVGGGGTPPGRPPSDA